ncbi:hypothetical protein [Streptomyces sp. NPDC048248]|uniref:hypothetical protein n=1 Tax=Streptomyces sp. NPDC048248 TaxID=3365523 RepID=UPI00371E99E2
MRNLGEVLKSTPGIGVLVGAALLSVAASGTAVAAPQGRTASERVGTNAAIADGYFKPGANTVVKRNIPQQIPANSSARLKAAGGNKVTYSRPKEVCGTELLEKTSGKGKATLVMSVETSMKAEASGEFGVSKGAIAAKLGFSTDDTFTLKQETRYEVPKGKMGFIEAYPTFDQYTINTYVNGALKKTGWWMKPTGVCFNQWTH